MNIEELEICLFFIFYFSWLTPSSLLIFPAPQAGHGAPAHRAGCAVPHPVAGLLPVPHPRPPVELHPGGQPGQR